MNPFKRRAVVVADLLAALLLTTCLSVAQATTVRQMTIVDLLAHSDAIVAGKVSRVADGFGANGLPYTEVTIAVTDTIRGQKSPTYTFRQFGLDKPRVMPDGRVYLGRPPGWPTWTENETAIVFLYPQAPHTGFQTTVGLGHGKVSFANGIALNGYDNVGLFENVKARGGLLDSQEQKMFATRTGAVKADVFSRFLHRAVNGNWAKNGGLSNAQR